MIETPTLTAAVREAIRTAPTSTLELARTAGVPAPTLSQIRHGVKGASPALAEKLRVVLEAWAASCSSAAKDIAIATERAAR